MAVTEEIACKQRCGKTFTTEGWRVKHELKCNGPVATEGRIAARELALIPVGRSREPAIDEKTKRRREQYRASKARTRNGHTDRTPPAAALPAIQGAATDKAIEVVIAGLTAKRDAIDSAIAALQAVSA